VVVGFDQVLHYAQLLLTWKLLEALMSDRKFEIGDPVEKHAGEYGGPGEVVGHFEVKAGAWRYNVAHRIEGGFGRLIHIYSENQIRRRT
jgi:hypothetical protein